MSAFIRQRKPVTRVSDCPRRSSLLPIKEVQRIGKT
jgi:hypothetical protein